MLAGMYVVRDETPVQVRRIDGGVRGYGDTVTPTQYTLAPLGADHLAYLTDPMADQVPLLPECAACRAAAGWPCNECHGAGNPDWEAEMAARAKGVQAAQANVSTDPFRRSW